MSGKVMVTFDDGTADQYDAAKLLSYHGLHGVFGIVTNQVGRSGYMSEDQLQELKKDGHSIVNHSSNHWRTGHDPQRPYLVAHSPQDVTQDALSARDWLNERGLDGEYYIAPFGTLNIYGLDHLKELLSYFKFIRLTKGIPTLDGLWSYNTLQSTFRDAYHSVNKVDKLIVGVTEPADVRRPEGVTEVANQAVITNTLVVICYHLVRHVVGEDQKVTWERFDKDIQYIAELVQNRGLECVIPQDLLL